MIRAASFIRIIPFALVATLAAVGEGRPGITTNGKSRADANAVSAGSLPKGLAASDWSSIRAAYEAGRHKIFANEKGWSARNPGQGLNTTFDERGFTTKPDSGSWSWGLDLQSYGWGATNLVTTPRATSTDGGRLSRAWDGVITEWYVNDTRGLEHGFTVASRPTSASAPLTVDLSIRGGLRPVVSQDGRNVSFKDAQGGSALNYNSLTVIDSAGQTVSAKWFPLGDNQLRLQVNDFNAKYPLTIDPVVQQAYLKASNTSSGDQFGYSVAVSGDTVVVGAPLEDSAAVGVNGNQADNSAANSGAAYVFVRSGGVWSQQAYLKASNTDPGDEFGFSVAISGDTVVVGAYKEDSTVFPQVWPFFLPIPSNNSYINSGAAYVFVRTNGVWSHGQDGFLKATNVGVADQFGYSVAISGDTLVVGANQEQSNATGVNSNYSDNSANFAGAAYIFIRFGSGWMLQAYVKASNTGAFDEFGCSVAISGNTVVVGAIREASNATGVNGDQANNSAVQSGAVYVFVRTGSVWSQQAYLKASNTEANDRFGISVAVSGDTVVVGADFEDSNATGVNGDQANNSFNACGAAYVFVRTVGVWSQQAYLKSSNTEANDIFGRSVAIWSDIVVVGASREGSNATGVNGNQADNSAVDSGATYVFVRTAGVWSQQAYLKASNTGSTDRFGVSVAISGDTVVVGAWQEDSNATGVNGNQSDNSATDSGAAYIFDLDNNPGTSSYGTGTPGCAGIHTLDVTHAPMINSPNFAITCSNAPPLSLGLGLVTDSQDLAGTDVFGVGVLIHSDIVFAIEILTFDFYSDATGYSETFGTGIPNEPLLIGKTYYASALWAWTTCSLSPFNLSSSRGLAITILAP